MPSRLYKYMSLRTLHDQDHVRRVLLESRAYFAPRRSFKDPFDCAATYHARGTDAEFTRYCQHNLKTRQPRLTPAQRTAAIEQARVAWRRSGGAVDAGAINGLIDQFGILCLSAVRNHVYMWSQYADRHAGVCLEFRSTGSRSLVRRAHVVRYRLRFPVVPILKLSSHQLGRAIFTRKAPWWKHEHEWRVVDSSGPGERPFAPGELSGLVLGAQVSPKTRKTVLSWVADSPSRPALYEARMHTGKYRLTVHAL